MYGDLNPLPDVTKDMVAGASNRIIKWKIWLISLGVNKEKLQINEIGASKYKKTVF